MNVKSKKATSKKKAEREYLDVTSYSVTNARAVDSKNGVLVFFSLKLNGIFINNCRVATGKNGDFISFPSYKGSNGEYYNTVYAVISPEDTEKILADVEKAINSDEVPFE